MQRIVWSLPLKTVSEANKSEHWLVARRRHKQQQFFIRRLFAKRDVKIPTPCMVKLVRLAGRELDKDDNLRMAFKWIKDEIADCLFPEKQMSYVAKNGKIIQLKGRTDDSPLVKWEYDQERSRILGIRIEISPLESLDA